MGGASLESSNGQDAEPADDEENLQPFSQERQAFIKESLDKWCEELGYKDTTVNMFTLSRSLNISKNELSRYFTACLNSSFRIWLAEVRFEAAKKMMLDYPDYSNDIISAECGFSSRSYLSHIQRERRMLPNCLESKNTIKSKRLQERLICKYMKMKQKKHHKQPDKWHIIIWRCCDSTALTI